MILDRKYIRESGSGTVQDVVRTLPQNFRGGVSETLRNVRAGEVNQNFSAAVNLRGLGAGSTLTLLDGRRLAPSNVGTYVDISVIPLAAVERIEVVTDGSSAIYGSDAIAGVTNIILRNNFRGAETGVRVAMAPDRGYAEYSASQLVGDAWGSGHAMAGYEFSGNDPLTADALAVTSNLPANYGLISRMRRHSGFIDFHQNVGEDFSVFATGLFSYRRNDKLGANPLIGGVNLGDASATSFSITAGVTWDFASDWEAELALTHSQSLSKAFTNAPAQQIRSRGYSEWQTSEFKVSGPIADLPGGALKIAVGSSLSRQETSYSTLNVPTNARSGFADDRSIFAAYSEAQVPIVGADNAMPGIKRLEVSVAGRYEHYSDFGDSFNPKASLLWEPIAGFLARATIGRSFKAPDFNDYFVTPQVILGNFPDASVPTPGGRTPALYLFGASNLQPEKAKSWTAGFDIGKEKPFGISATYFSIDFRGRIGTPAATIVDILLAPGAYSPVIRRGATPSEVAAFAALAPLLDATGGTVPLSAVSTLIDYRVANLGVTRSRGIDVDLHYHFTLGGERFSLTAAGSYLLENSTRLTTSAPDDDARGRTWAPPVFVGRAGLSWSDTNASLAAFANYRDDYTDRFAVPVGRVKERVTFDLAGSYTFQGGMFRGIEAGLTVTNLFDREPQRVATPLAGLEPGYDSTNSDPRGRLIAFRFVKRW